MVNLLRYRVKTGIILELIPQYGLVVKGLSRLPVTEEIAGSNPVEPANKNCSPSGGLFLLPVRPGFESAIASEASKSPGRVV